MYLNKSIKLRFRRGIPLATQSMRPIEALEQRTLLAYVPDLFTPDQLPPSPTFGSYTPDIVRQFDRNTGALITTVTSSYIGVQPAPWSRPVESVIDGSYGTNLDLLKINGADPATAQFTITIDLHAVRSVNRIRQAALGGRMAVSYTIQSSLDGNTFTTLVGPKAPGGDGFDSFAPTNMRYIRYIGTGLPASNEFNFGEIQAFLDQNATPPTKADGLDVTYEPENVTITNETPDNWYTFSTNPRLASSIYTQGKPLATGDASGVIDLGKVHRVIGINAIFDNYETGYPDLWSSGGTIQVRALASDPWQTVYDSNSNMSTQSLNFAAAPKDIRYIRFVNKRGVYPANTGFYGQNVAGLTGTGIGRMSHIEVITATPAPYTPIPIKTLNVPATGVFSAAVYDSTGKLVRTLARAKSVTAGTLPIYWDGYSDTGALLPINADYEIRHVFSQATAPVVTEVGNSGTPGNTIPPLFEESNSASGNVGALAVDATGFYTGSGFEENSTDLRKISLTGQAIWNLNGNDFLALSSDGTYLYAINTGGATAKLYRVRASDGFYASYDGTFSKDSFGTSVTTLLSNNPDPRPAGTSAFTRDQIRDFRAYTGISADTATNALFLSDHVNNRIEVWNKSTGAAINLSALNLTNPMGIAIDPRGGAIWVAYNNDRISKFSFNTTTLAINPTAIVTITGLNDPVGLSIADLDAGANANYHLFATEAGRDKIREWDINGATPVNTGVFADFGQLYAPGPLADNEFNWTNAYSAPIAVATGGVVNVADPFNHRTMRFNANGSVYQRMYKEYVPSPWVDRATVTGNTHSLISGSMEYQVNVAGQTYADGLGDKTWRVAANWRPADGAFFGDSYFSPTKRITLDVNKGTGQAPLMRTFLYNRQSARTDGLIAYEVNGGNVRRASAVGDFWTGADDTLTPDYKSWTWTDTDGDGNVDFVSSNDSTDEVLWLGGLAFGWGQIGTIDVDNNGDIWVSNGSYLGAQPTGNSIYKIPLAGFEKVAGQDKYNPIYHFADAQLFVNGSTTRDPANNQQFAYIGKPTADGGFLTETMTISTGVYPTIRIYNNTGQQTRSYAPLLKSSVNFAQPDPDPTSGYFYDINSGGPMSWIYLRDADGLAVAYISGEGSGWESNWIDNNAGVDVFIQNGQRYVYAEDVYLGKQNLHRIDGLNTVQKSSFTFTWPGFENWDGSGVHNNAPPTAGISGPTSVNEGSSITLSGANSTAGSGGAIAKYEWDLNYDGQTFTVDASSTSSSSVSFSAASIDGPATRTVALRVVDASQVSSAIATASVGIVNVAPTAVFSGSTVAQGNTGTVTFSTQNDASGTDRTAGYKYSYDFNNDGTFEQIDAASATATVPASYIASAGAHTIAGRIKDKDGGSRNYTANVQVTAVVAPTAKPGGPYSVNEGAQVTLSGANSTAGSGGAITNFEWDLNYDGITFTADATGSATTFSATALDGPLSRTIGLRVTDASLVSSAIATTTVGVTNVAPTATFNGATITQGSTGTVTFSAQTDPSSADRTAGYKYSYDFNNDGTFEQVDIAAASATVPASDLTTLGAHTIAGRIKDKDGGSRLYTANVQVNAATLSTVRINAGGSALTDSKGAAWAADSGFVGGSISNGAYDVVGTTDDALYAPRRIGTNVSFSKTVVNGNYQLRLLLADPWWSNAGQRKFDVFAEGQLILDDYDIVQDVGAKRAVDKTFAVTVADGTLNLLFISSIDNAIVSGIELIPATGTPVPRPTVRINAAGGAFTDASGNAWSADSGFSASTVSTGSYDVLGTTDDVLYSTRRFAQNFTFAKTIANGNYQLKLLFAEPYWGAVGQRKFDVFAEGNLILDDFDLVKDSGAKVAIAKTFNVSVADGTLNLSFIASLDNAIISGIEIVPV